MKNNIGIAIPILLVILISGCVGSGGKDQPGAKPFATGTNGLAFSFQKNAPPEATLAGETFPISLVIENKGAFDVPAGGARLVLGDAATWGFPQGNTKTNTEELVGRRIYGISESAGSKEVVDFGNAKYSSEFAPPEEEAKTILSDACYYYNTKVQSSLCISSGEGICNPSGQKKVYSSSAPVQITDFKQLLSKKSGENTYDLAFNFKIKNAGTGDVYSTDLARFRQLGDCAGLDGKASDNVDTKEAIYLRNFGFSPNPAEMRSRELVCSRPTDQLPALKEERTVTCTLKGVVSSSEAEEPVLFTLGYVYRDLVKTSINIIPPPKTKKAI